MTTALFFLFAGCSSPTPVQTVQPVTPQAPPSVPPVVGVDPVGTLPLPTPPVDAREVRRMDIDQLDASIRSATGGIGWDVDGVSQFAELAPSLGVPDYTTRTSEDLTAGLLFQKFLDDAASTVCEELVSREAAGTSNVLTGAADPSVTRAAAPAIADQAIANAVLRFHGRRLAPGEPALDEWTYLFDTTVTVTGGDTLAAWRAVCIGLIVHPDFYTY